MSIRPDLQGPIPSKVFIYQSRIRASAQLVGVPEKQFKASKNKMQYYSQQRTRSFPR